MPLTIDSIEVRMLVVASSCENCASCATNASFWTGSSGFWFCNCVVNSVRNSVLPI